MSPKWRLVAVLVVLAIALVTWVAWRALDGHDRTTASRLPLPDRALLAQAIELASGATVKIEGSACGLATAGSGVVVAPGVVLTAAHVVAGSIESRIVDSTGRHRAIPIVVDPLADLAVLFSEDLADQPLIIGTAPAGRGTNAAVLGYPNAGAFQASPAVVLDNYSAEGHDIYGQQRIVRQIIEVQSKIEPGSSGGPLVDVHGAMIGMVFGQSEDEPDIGYALTSTAIREVIDAALGLTAQGPAAVSTGACLASHS